MLKYTLLLGLFLGFSTSTTPSIDEEVIIFVQPTTDSEFTTENITSLVSFLQSNKIATKIINVEEEGAPAIVSFTPFIVYRNALGVTPYKGRYTTHRRLLNFVRSSRRTPPSTYKNEVTDVFTQSQAKGNIVFKIKITDPTGELPKGFDIQKEKAMFQQGLKKGYSSCETQDSYSMTIADEIFYCNFYPYYAADGKKYVSYEIYSGYDCHTPIYVQFDQPSTSKNTSRVFANAAKATFEEINQQLQNSKNGDAKNYLSPNSKLTDWKNLNLSDITAAAKEANTSTVNADLPLKFDEMQPLDEGSPMLSFIFPNPLQQYGGQFNNINGQIQLKEKNSLEGAYGEFIVQIRSIDMGLGDLTDYALDAILSPEEHPTATFKIETIAANNYTLAMGKITQAMVKGQLTMLGKSFEIETPADFQPFVDEAGKASLMIDTQFKVSNLDYFGIKGPDGPEEASNTITIDATFKIQ